MIDLTDEELIRRYNAGERNFSGLTLRNVNLEGLDLRGINLSGVNLIGANLKRTNLTRANLSGANLEMASIDNTILIETNFERAFIEGIFNSDFRGANLARIHMVEGMIVGCDMERVNLGEAMLADICMGSVNLRNANLEGIEGSVSMNEVDLTGATGFESNILCNGYWNLTLPDGRFITDWEIESI